MTVAAALAVAIAMTACEAAPTRSQVAPPPPPATPDASSRPTKRATLEAMLRRGSVLITFDARRDGVVAPVEQRTESDFVLRIYRDNQPVITDTAIAVSVQIAGQPVHYVVPWSAIYILGVEGEHAPEAWAADAPAPPEVAWDPIIEPKLRVVTAALGRGSILLQFDARHAGVVLPRRLRDEGNQLLRFGRDLEPAIPDLALDRAAISGTLRFDGQAIKVTIPWAAVYGVEVEGEPRGVWWPADVPADQHGHK